MRIGAESNVLPLRSVLVKRPRHAGWTAEGPVQGWRDLDYPAEPDGHAAGIEHDAFVQQLVAAGAEVHELPQAPDTGPDSIYVHDSLIVTRSGAILCRMGKEARAGEPAAAAAWLGQAGIPVLGRIEGTGRLEGGDLIWLDGRTVAVGEGYRTNAEGIRQLATTAAGLVDELITVPLPHWKGPSECMHLMSLVSPISASLMVVYRPLLPVPFLEVLSQRGFTLIDVPDAEFPSMGANVLALGEGRCLMLEGNPTTRGRLEAAGVAVTTYEGREISLTGGGGPTCLTRPLLRTS